MGNKLGVATAFVVQALAKGKRELKESNAIKQQVLRRQCVNCGKKIGEGRAGRKCRDCQNSCLSDMVSNNQEMGLYDHASNQS